MSKMNIAIVGSGAMGSLYAALLARSGQQVWLLEKDRERVAAIARHGLSIKEADGDWHIPFDRITCEAEDLGLTDLVLLFVKAYDTSEAMHGIAPAVRTNTTVLTLQNGLGNIEQIRQHVTGSQILAGTTAQGATLVAHGHIHHAGAGETIIGAPERLAFLRAEPVRALLSAAGITTTIAEDIQAVLWRKLLVNMCINPLTAILRIRNGEIVEHQPLRQLVEEIVAEGVAVAEKLEIRIQPGEIVSKVLDVCRVTADNLSSMHQDIRWHRKTEIAQINGAVAEHARRLGVDAPINAMLSDLVLSIEKLCAGV